MSLELAAIVHRYEVVRAAVFAGYSALAPGVVMAGTVLANALEADLDGFEASLDMRLA